LSDAGAGGGKLLGNVTSRDIQFQLPPNPISVLMPMDLIAAREGITLHEANAILRDSIEGRLVSLLARSDLLRNQKFPLVSKRPEIKQLYTAVAIGARPGDRERLKLLVVDIVVLDSIQSNSISNRDALMDQADISWR